MYLASSLTLTYLIYVLSRTYLVNSLICIDLVNLLTRTYLVNSLTRTYQVNSLTRTHLVNSLTRIHLVNSLTRTHLVNSLTRTYQVNSLTHTYLVNSLTCVDSLNRGVESFTISNINFSIHGSNKRFFDTFYESSWAESSINFGKITKQLLYSVNMFIWIDNGKYITAINKKFIHFFLFGYHGYFVLLILKTI